MWVFYSLLANLMALILEYLYRTRFYPNYLAGLPVILPIALILQFGLFYSFRFSPSYLSAWLAFFSVNLISRALISRFVLEEPMSWLTIAGLFLVVIGAILSSFK
jgi:hypothetical protein